MDLSGASALVVLHAFQNAPAAMRVPLPKGTWRVRGSLAGKGVSLQENTILWQPGADFSGEVLLLAAESSHPLL